MKKLVGLLLILTMMMTTVACGSKATNDAESTTSEGGSNEVIEIKLGANLPKGTPITDACFKFEEELEARTDGKVDVIVFPAGQLGGGREMIESLQFGSLEMVESTLGPFAGFNKEFLAFNLPYLFKNRDVAYEFLDGAIADEMRESVIKDGFKILAFWDNGYRNVSNSVKAIKTPSDLDGMKIRTMENPVHMEAFKQAGANPTPMAFTEVFTALQQKTVDGQENSFTNTAAMKFNEVQDHVSTTNHFYDVTAFIINPEFFDGLPSDIQTAVLESAEVATEFQRQATIEADKLNEEKVAGTSTITYLSDEEKLAFKKAMEGTYDEFRDQIGAEKLDQIIAELDRIEASIN